MVLTLLFLFVALTAILFYEDIFFDEEMQSIEMRVSVVNGTKIGFAVEEGLNFGILPLGTRGRKIITLKNKEDRRVKAHLWTEGDITPFVEISESTVLLEPQMNKDIEIAVHAKKVGNYTGVLKIKLIKPKQKLFEALLQWV